ncbi:MAG TPA: hypothetical protein PK360_14835 [bacterium]|nr:hypothetical protein [bacterium]
MKISNRPRFRPFRAAIFMSACLLAYPAASSAVDLWGETIDGRLDLTYSTQYLWHGYDVFDDNGTFQPRFQLEWNGLYAGVVGEWPDSGGHVNQTEINPFLGYECTLFQDEWYALYNYITYVYYTHPKTGNELDKQELANGLSFPNLIPLGPSHLVPFVDTFFIWDGTQSSRNFDSGNIVVFGVSYAFPIPPLLGGQDKQDIDLRWDVTYNDGALNTNSAWSHTTLEAATTFKWNGLYFTPAVDVQFSLDDSPLAVNSEDEVVASFTLGYRF